MTIQDRYLMILYQEMRFIPANWESYTLLTSTPTQMYRIAKRILEIAKNSTVIRSGNITGRLTTDGIAYESDGAHTNLMRAMVDYAIDHVYNLSDQELPYYNDRVIHEAILLHDLPENLTGDIADNRKRDELQKAEIETQYYTDFSDNYGDTEKAFYQSVMYLLDEMSKKSSREGCLLYTADKVSAIIMMLAYDQLKLFPHAFANDDSLSNITLRELNLCEMRSPEGGLLLSELWTIDYLCGRNLIQYDKLGFFTALLIMITLIVHGNWYHWRESMYKKG